MKYFKYLFFLSFRYSLLYLTLATVLHTLDMATLHLKQFVKTGAVLLHILLVILKITPVSVTAHVAT